MVMHHGEEDGSAHTETNIMKLLVACDVQNIVYHGRDIVLAHLVPAVVYCENNVIPY